MTHDQIKALYPEPPGYSDEIGRYVGRNGATYRAWRNGTAQRIDPDADSRRYGEESGEVVKLPLGAPAPAAQGKGREDFHADLGGPQEAYQEWE